MYTETTAAPVVGLPTVRRATMDDLDEVLRLGHELYEENGLMGLDENAIRQAAVSALSGGDGIVGVIGKNPIEGMIFLSLRVYWYTRDVHLEEMLNVVDKRFRRSRNAIALIEFAKSASLRLGVPLLIGIVSNEKTIQKIRLYERRLGKQSGAYFVWNGKTGKG